jgi:hypothetical protein
MVHSNHGTICSCVGPVIDVQMKSKVFYCEKFMITQIRPVLQSVYNPNGSNSPHLTAGLESGLAPRLGADSDSGSSAHPTASACPDSGCAAHPSSNPPYGQCPPQECGGGDYSSPATRQESSNPGGPILWVSTCPEQSSSPHDQSPPRKRPIAGAPTAGGSCSKTATASLRDVFLPTVYDALLVIRPSCNFRHGTVIKNYIGNQAQYFAQLPFNDSYLMGLIHLCCADYRSEYHGTFLIPSVREDRPYES